MRKNSILSVVILGATLGLASCMQNDFNLAEGEGTIHIRTSISEDVTVVSRASDTKEALDKSLQLWVCKENGSVVREYKDLATVPENIKLVAGSYFVEGWAGDSVPASFNDKYFYGRSQVFKVVNNEETNVSLTCNIQNVVVSVEYDQSVSDVLKDYEFTIGHKVKSLTFVGDTDQKGYFMMPSVDKDLSWTLTGTTFDDKPYSRSGKIENVKKATEYAVTITYNYGEASNLGGGYLDISIDDTPIDPTENKFELALAPTILGLGTTDLSKTVSGEANEIGLQAFLVAGASPLSEVVLSCGLLCDQLGYQGQTDIDLLNMGESVSNNLESHGLSCTIVKWENVTDQTGPLVMQVVFYEEFISNWTYGDYTINITALDTKGKSTSATLHILITQAKVDTDEAEVVMDWGAPYVLLKGRKIKDASSYGIVYSINGGEETYAEATLSDNNFSVKVTGLKPGDKISYKAACDYNTPDKFVSASTKNIQMPNGTQLPNSSFETWITLKNENNKDFLCPSLAADNLFWGTGNPGSAKMNINVTNPSGTYKNSGEKSAFLQSQFVNLFGVGKFAAGNIFIGEYLKTDGTDGILGFGKKIDFNYKPKALALWVRYQPQPIDNLTADVPSEANVKMGDMDQGIIYFALLSDTQDEEYNGKKYPVIIKTKAKDRQLFDKDAANVIAYGERIFTTAVGGEGMIRVEIPFDYKLDIKPTYIMCTCAASRYGDYFSGGPSTMYVDDVEIVY